MSLLVDNTYANPLNPLWAAAGSGGGGGASTLQSPASVTPAPLNGSCTLSLVNAAGGGDSVVNIQDTTGNLAILNLANAVGGDSIISMGVLGGSKVNLVAPSSNQGQVQIQANATGTSYLTVDTVNNNVVVGDLGSVGTINLNCSTVIKDSGAGANGIGLTPTSATTSVISNTIAANGSLFIGSSLAQSTTLNVTENAGNGYLEVLGRGSANGVFLAGGANQAVVTTNTVSGGQMSIGCSNTGNYDAILITDTPQSQTVIKNLIPPAISTGNNVYFAGPFAMGGGNVIPAPVGLAAGVYMMAVNGIAASYFAQTSCLAYWTGSVWGSGGAMISPGNGTGALSIFPDITTAGAIYYENLTGASITATLILIPLFVGNIPSLA
jgi:hypothetical protein